MAKQSLAYGTFILTMASLLNRVLGFVYQIVLVRLIHAEGIGLFSMVYPVYIMLLVLASAGIPVAIAKLVAEEMARKGPTGAYRIFRIGLNFIVFFAVLTTSALVLGGDGLLQRLFANPDVRMAFTVLIPGILIVSVCSAFRGFFQGLQQMSPTALSQILEQCVRVAVGLGLAYWLLPYGVAYATAGASAGIVAGEAVGFASMLAIYARKRPRVPRVGHRNGERLLTASRRIFSLAVPVTLTRFVSSGLMSLDAVLIPRRLVVAGLSTLEATAVYGKLVGMAETLLFTPGILTISLSTALVPVVAEARAQGNRRLMSQRVNNALKLTVLTGVPSAVIFLLVPSQLCSILYGYPDAGRILGALALGGPFLYIVQTTTGILQGLGKAVEPFKNLLFASALKLTGIYYLTGLPEMGIIGTSLALVSHFVLMAVLNTRDVVRITGVKINYSNTVLKPLFAGLVMAVAMALVLENGGPGAAAAAAAMAVGLSAYFLVAVITGAIERSHIERAVQLLIQASQPIRRFSR
ncbi:MAG: stage V sporulation protein B [Bacillota bacterium]